MERSAKWIIRSDATDDIGGRSSVALGSTVCIDELLFTSSDREISVGASGRYPVDCCRPETS